MLNLPKKKKPQAKTCMFFFVSEWKICVANELAGDGS